VTGAAAGGAATIAPCVKWPGSKWRLARWIAGQLPPHETYLEPFFGSGAVFFSKPPSAGEILNDLDGDVVNLFRVLRDAPDELARLVALTPYAREEYEASYDRAGCAPEERARRFLVRTWQAIGSRVDGPSGWRHSLRRDVGTPYYRQWARLPARLLAATARLQGAQLECRPALEVLDRYAGRDALVYADPPYPLATRARTQYAREMRDAEHPALLDALDAFPGPVLLSGYRCPLYDARLAHWLRVDRAAAAEGGRARVESLWLSPRAVALLERRQLPLVEALPG
jgi:DNA adenine methylase